MIKNPIISLSLPKSGTTTLAVALKRAGLNVADWRIRTDQTKDETLHTQLVAPLLYEDYFDSGDPLKRLGDFDAITEMSAVSWKQSMWPQMDSGLLAAIETHHPGARFLLSMRAPEEVATSIMGWNNLGRRRLPNNDVPGLPKGFGGNVPELTRWVAGHYAFCERVFRGYPNFLAYRLDDPDVQTKISTFLALDLPWWGKANTNKKTRDAEKAAGA